MRKRRRPQIHALRTSKPAESKGVSRAPTCSSRMLKVQPLISPISTWQQRRLPIQLVRLSSATSSPSWRSHLLTTHSDHESLSSSWSRSSTTSRRSLTSTYQRTLLAYQVVSTLQMWLWECAQSSSFTYLSAAWAIVVSRQLFRNLKTSQPWMYWTCQVIRSVNQVTIKTP